ncbi:MAG: hypothetical protein Q8O89_00400 [Nanoarchaeota archaeon]|nr:hypothetical protein [Nanoarchaeota archaeon]
MAVKQKYDELMKSDVFKSWKQEHDTSFFAHAFALVEPDGSGEWQFGFFDTNNRLMTSFMMSKEIMVSPETEVFEKPGNEIQELDMGSVKIDFPEAISCALDFQKNSYPTDAPIKRIILLQNIDGKAIWNISFLSQKFNVLNIRIDAATNKVVEHKLDSMLDFVDKGSNESHNGCGCGHNHSHAPENCEDDEHPCGGDCKCSKEKINPKDNKKLSSKSDYIL